MADLQQIKALFKGRFLAEPQEIAAKLGNIKAYVFDWDGVFNNGEKNENGSSPYNEIDSMGLNMLRFNHYSRTWENPIVAVITGERNNSAFALAEREHFHAVYFKIKNKIEALTHLCETHHIDPVEVAFCFDDVLDLSVAGKCGLRMMVPGMGNPMFQKLVVENKFADYITGNTGGQQPVREITELLMGVTGRYDETIMDRANYTDLYARYLDARNSQKTVRYTTSGAQIRQTDQ